MILQSNGVWVSGISRRNRTRFVARETLRGRLVAVQERLPLAAEEASQDIEHVHRLRVATRRAVAAVQMYQDLLPRRTTRRLQKQLKKIRSAAGKARDLDVLISDPKTAGNCSENRDLLTALRASRIQAQQPIVDIHQRLQSTSALDDSIASVLATLTQHKRGPRQKDLRFAKWARPRLKKRVNRFFNAEPKDWRDLEALHRFRIRAKELRYTMELLAAAFPKSFRTCLYPQVTAVQEKLGEINDHFNSLERFRRLRDTADDPSDRDRFNELVASRHKDLERSRKRFVDWWTGGRRKKLRRKFRRALCS